MVTKTCSWRNKLGLLYLEDLETIKISYFFPSSKFQDWDGGISLERARQAIYYYHHTLYFASVGKTTVPFCKLQSCVRKRILAPALQLLTQWIPTGSLITKSWLWPHFCGTTKVSLGSSSFTIQLRPSRAKDRSHDVAPQKQQIKHEECDLWCIRFGSIL